MTLINHEGIVSDPNLLAEKFGPEYRFTWPQLALAVTAWDVRDGRDGALNATLQCFAIHGETLSPCSAPTPSNITGARTKNDTARFFASKFSLPEDDNLVWADLIERISAIIQWDIRQGEPIEDLSAFAVPEGQQHLIYPYLPLNDTTIWVGNEATFKSYFAKLCALSVITGRALVPHSQPPGRQGNVLFLDWEASRDEQIVRLSSVAQGAGLDETPHFYYRRETAPIRATYRRIAAEVERMGIALVVADSLGPATGDSNDQAMAMETMAALRSLNTTVLAIAHYAKGQRDVQGPRSVFGSIWFENMSRSRWEVRSTADSIPGVYHLTAMHTKNSNGPKFLPQSMKVQFAGRKEGEPPQPVWFTSEDTDPTSEASAGVPLPTRILQLLRQSNEALPTNAIAEDLGAEPETIRRSLERMKDRTVVVVGELVTGSTRGKPQNLWGLLERRDGDGVGPGMGRLGIRNRAVGMAQVKPDDLTECAACLRQMPVARYDDMGAPICVSCDAMGVENAPRRAEPVHEGPEPEEGWLD